MCVRARTAHARVVDTGCGHGTSSEHTPILVHTQSIEEDDNVYCLFYGARSCQQSLSVPEGGRKAVREQPDGEDRC